MNKELHPFIKGYPLSNKCKYLVLGTFPPSQKLCTKDDRQFNIDYFYGNVSSFWKIIQEVYPNNKFTDIESILNWQDQYSIGISDTILSCKRKKQDSSRDSDLIIDWPDYNHQLKEFTIENEKSLEKIIFTSGYNYNNAIYNFKIIMGSNFSKVESKVVDNLPSPSGDSNLSFFTGNEDTYGLKEDFFDFIINHTDKKTVEFVKHSYDIKKKTANGVKVKRIPKGVLKLYKIFMYKKIFPKSI